MPVTKAQQNAVAKYRKNNYDQLKVEVKKGQKEIIQAHAAEHGESLNSFVNKAIYEKIERDNAKIKEVDEK